MPWACIGTLIIAATMALTTGKLQCHGDFVIDSGCAGNTKQSTGPAVDMINRWLQHGDGTGTSVPTRPIPLRCEGHEFGLSPIKGQHLVSSPAS